MTLSYILYIIVYRWSSSSGRENHFKIPKLQGLMIKWTFHDGLFFISCILLSARWNVERVWLRQGPTEAEKSPKLWKIYGTPPLKIGDFRRASYWDVYFSPPALMTKMISYDFPLWKVNTVDDFPFWSLLMFPFQNSYERRASRGDVPATPLTPWETSGITGRCPGDFTMEYNDCRL